MPRKSLRLLPKKLARKSSLEVVENYRYSWVKICFLFLGLFVSLSARAELLLEVELQSGHWISKWGEIEVPPGIASFQLFVQGSDNTLLQISDLVDPTGEIWVSSGATEKKLTPYHQPVLSGAISLNRSEAVVPGFASLLVPNQLKKTVLPPGKWRVRVYTHKEPLEKKLKVKIFSKTKIAEGSLPVQIWVSSRSVWAKDEEFTKMLRRVSEIYAAVGIAVDFSSPLLVDAPHQLPLEVPQDLAEIAKALNVPGKLNLYFLPEMELQSKEMNGLACIGGPIRTDFAHPCFAAVFAGGRKNEITLEQRAKVVVHEMAHYLGLHHTQDTGYQGLKVVYDSFDDTPETITGENLMDPGIHKTNPTFSGQQKELLLFHPGIR
jgi:hypothetical protein